jgi:hypothetical protein
LDLSVVFSVFFSHGVDESHQNAKTASHDNASDNFDVCPLSLAASASASLLLALPYIA